MSGKLNQHTRLVIGVSLLLLILALAGCGGGPTPAPAQPTSPPPAPTATSAAPTATVAAPASPTVVAVQPTATKAAVVVPTTSTGFGNAVPSGGKLGAEGNFATSGNYLSDFGFRSDASGFSFENYGAGNYTNLTADEMRRFFGDRACASLAEGKCVLHPQIQEIMEAWNKSMAGGHCYGFSVAALRFYQKQLNPADFGGATIADLKIDGNEKLQREIAYAFAFQFLRAVRETMIGGTPNDVLDKLSELLKPGASAPESWTIGFFKAEGGGGHAVTPYAVEDLGNGIFAVIIYDNNFPKATRAILFDRNQNRWSYQASINPSVPAELYYGDAQTKSLFLFPTNPGTKLLTSYQQCPVCLPRDGERIAGVAAPDSVGLTPKFNIIFLERDPKAPLHLLVTDEQGRRSGYLPDGKLVSEIPGVQVERPFMSSDVWNEDEEPTYYIPVGMKFTITIDGSLLKAASAADVVMVGPGYDLGVENIKLNPGQKDTLTLSPDGSQLSYKTASSEAPDIILGLEQKDGDYAFLVKGVDLDGGGVVNVGLNLAKGQLSIGSRDSKKPGTYGLVMHRIDQKGEQTFSHDDDIVLAPGDTAYLDFGKWAGKGSTIPLEIDHGSKGKIDEIIELTSR